MVAGNTVWYGSNGSWQTDGPLFRPRFQALQECITYHGGLFDIHSGFHHQRGCKRAQSNGFITGVHVAAFSQDACEDSRSHVFNAFGLVMIGSTARFVRHGSTPQARHHIDA